MKLSTLCTTLIIFFIFWLLAWSQVFVAIWKHDLLVAIVSWLAALALGFMLNTTGETIAKFKR